MTNTYLTSINSILDSSNTADLGTFLKVGPQRASGVRIVCLRLCCSVDPRTASCRLQ